MSEIDSTSSLACELASLASMTPLEFLAAAAPAGLISTDFPGGLRRRRSRPARLAPLRNRRAASLATSRGEHGLFTYNWLGREPEKALYRLAAKRVLKTLEQTESLLLEGDQRILLSVGNQADALPELLDGAQMLDPQVIERLQQDPPDDL